jgi:hypothetical protein
VTRISIDHSEIPPNAPDVFNASAHFTAGSALSEFMAGRLGAPGCWPDDGHRNSTLFRGSEEASSIHRWENEGGRTMPAVAPGKGLTFALRHFHPTHPLLTQLL